MKNKAITKTNKAVGVSSVTKREGGFMPTARPWAENVSKRRVKGYGQAAGRVKAKANKEIKAERKATGERKYEKEFYGRRSVNQSKPTAKVKPSSKRMSSIYKGKRKVY